MKRYLTYLLCIVSTIGWAENSFDAFCSKFPLMELPIVSDSRIYGDNLYYFQLDKESSITEEEFERFVKTSRWGQYQQPGDSSLHIYHYIPAGRAYFQSFILLFVNCGYMPLPEKYKDSDIGAYENLLLVYTADGKRIDAIVYSGFCCVSNSDGRFAAEWQPDMPVTVTQATCSREGKIVIERYRNNESAPYQIDNYRIDSISGGYESNKKTYPDSCAIRNRESPLSQELFWQYWDKFPWITDTAHYNYEDANEHTYGFGDSTVVITEQEFEAFIRNERWNRYSSPSDTLRYSCVGKLVIDDIYAVIVFCGWTPPEYLNTDFGYSQYLLSTFDAYGNRIASLDLELRGNLDSTGHLPYDVDYESISYIGGNTHIDPDGKIRATQLMIRFKDLFEKDWETKVKRENKNYSITLTGEIDLQS